MVLRIVFAGTPEPAVISLRALGESRHEVVAAITRPDAGRGRGRHSAASPVARAAADVGIAVLKPGRLDDPGFLARLSDLAPDVCAVVAYGKIIPATALAVPRLGWVNLHFSLLPAWRGAAPVQHAILHGDDITGATTFLIEEGLDTGPCYGRVTEAVRPMDTTGDLLERLARSGARLLVATMDALADGDVRAEPQPAEGVSLAPKFEPADVRIAWRAPALRIDRLIRAAAPAPGAWTTFGGERLKLGPVHVAQTSEAAGMNLAPGEVHAGKRAVWVGTGSCPVRLGTVQAAGKRPMPAVDWARGHRHPDGGRFA